MSFLPEVLESLKGNRTYFPGLRFLVAHVLLPYSQSAYPVNVTPLQELYYADKNVSQHFHKFGFNILNQHHQERSQHLLICFVFN